MSDRADETAVRPAVDPGRPAGATSVAEDDHSADRGRDRQNDGGRGADRDHESGRSGSGATSSGTSSAQGTPAQAAAAARGRGPRRARLRLTRIDPWSVMKTAFLLSIAFAVVTVVSVAMVWQVLGAAGVWESINSTIQESIGGEETSSFRVEDYVGTGRVLGFTMLVAAIDVVLITAAATLTAFLYNMAAALLGGVEVTLAEDAN
ncbi:DUF3566 domain-containing protein [Nocardioides sp. SYSU DS0651]|uniref:DUF3566 domain-containing protein n=1 Tax=Nocardioides sp. SYSU DS0651 TaxID=3415955 RepID=UPI003F4B5BB8